MMRVDSCPSWGDYLSFDSETGRIVYQSFPALTLASHLDLWIVRHAETFANQKKILQGSDQENEDTVLSPEGEAQAAAVADHLVRSLTRAEPGYQRISVLASPARRTGQTAQFFLKKMRNISPLACEYTEHSFLHEIRFGEISGLTEEQVFKLGADYIHFADRFRRRGDALIRLNGGESFHDLLLRVRKGFADWQSGLSLPVSREKTAVVLFTHMITASALRVLLRDEGLLDVCQDTGLSFVNWRRIIQNAECLIWDTKMRRMHLLAPVEGR
ncbi:MAG TPA: hypothetical protein DIS66_05615 [Candidatus Omnitrophica bacterium]|nr:hypothetical protein [Candidatus Omnitrophota bacterium]